MTAGPGTVFLGGELPLAPIGFGTMRLPGPGITGEPADPEAALRVLRRAVELGVTLIDTAAYYGAGVAERLIAEALYPYPSQLVITTKVGATRGDTGNWTAAARPEQLRAACEENLRRLHLTQLHLVHFRWMEDSTVPLAESVGALADLQRAGMIRSLGVSNVTLSQLQEAQHTAAIVSVQNAYNVEDRSSQPVLDVCTRDGLVFFAYFPLARGLLSRPGGVVAGIAARYGVTAAQVALAWLLHRSPLLVAIPGTASVRHLEENLAAATLQLSPHDVATLDALA